MSIGSALARGLTDASSGIAKASQNWPRERMEQARLDQNQTQFDITSGMRQEELDATIFTGQRTAEAKRRELLLKQMEEAREGLKMMIDAGAPADMLRPQWEEYNGIRSKITASTLDSPMPSPPKTSDEYTSDVSVPTAPEESATISEPVPTADPSVSAPAENIVDILANQMGVQRHNDALEVLEDVALKFGSDAAMKQYVTTMGDYLDKDRQDEAEELFADYAAGTLKERRTERRATIKAAIEAAASDDETAFAVWGTLNQSIEAEHGGWTSPEEALKVWERMRATDRSLDISGENQTRMGRIIAIKYTIGSALAKMSDPDIAKAFGGLEGLETEFNKRLINWVTPGEGQAAVRWDNEEAMQIISVLNEMKVSTDLLSRLQSGAALTAEEVSFYSALIGSITTNPKIIRQNMKDLMNTMVRMEEGIAEASYIGLYGMGSVLERVERRTGNIPTGVPGTPGWSTGTESAPADTSIGGIIGTAARRQGGG